jgi:DNA-binding CsgD family transcriptional regulator
MRIEEAKVLLEEIEKEHDFVVVNLTISINGNKLLQDEQVEQYARNEANLLRRISNKSTNELAEELKVSRMTFYHWLNGRKMREEHRKAICFLIRKELEQYGWNYESSIDF